MSGEFYVQNDGIRFYVFDASGRRVGVPYQSQASAQAQATRRNNQLNSDTTTRPCLSCSEPFRSEGKHNRLCATCRRRDDPLGPDCDTRQGRF